MAQILIRKRQHFAELVKPAGWSDLKWAGRPLQGDIVEVRENGYWRIEALGTGLRGWNREAFALIQVTNVTVAQAQAFAGGYSNETETTPATVRFKSRFRFASWASVPWTKTVVTVNGVTAEEWYYIRTNLSGAAMAILDKVTG